MRSVLFAALAAVIFSAAVFLASPVQARDNIVVGSKIDTEGALLGQMIILMLQKNGFEVEDRTEFGPTNIVRQAIISDQIDIYPEYTGNGGFFFENTDPAVWKDRQKAFETVKQLDMEQNGIVWLTPAPANNTWAIAVRQDMSENENLRTLTDLGQYITRGGEFKIACSEEFVTRPDALPAFQQAYGFELSPDQMLILSGGNTAQTEKAAAQNISGVNAAMAYGTDGALAALGLVVLEDSKGVQPVYEPAPIVRQEILAANPEIQGILDPVFRSLDLVTLQTLNAMIAIEGRDAAEVAREYLVSKKFL
ncbi:MAG: ABC transporter substrate-binding protein [Desulfovibrionales bacterium]